MAISKVVYKSSANATPVTWMDATPATAAASDIISPKTAMLANGVVTQGTGSGGGGSGKQYASGTYTADQTYTGTYDHEITTIASLGFTPSVFYMAPTDRDDVPSTQYAVLNAIYEKLGATGYSFRYGSRFSNTERSVGNYGNLNDWTTVTNGSLILSNGTIYYRTATQYVIPANVEYSWWAYE